MVLVSPHRPSFAQPRRTRALALAPGWHPGKTYIIGGSRRLHKPLADSRFASLGSLGSDRMKARSSLVALLVVSLCLAGVLPPTLIRPGAALPLPSQVYQWSIQSGGGPGGNPTVIIGRTEIDFRMAMETGVQASVTYYIFDASTATYLRDEGTNWIAGEMYGSVAVDVAGDSTKEIITVTPANNLRCMYRNRTQVWNRAFETTDQLGCPALYDLYGDGRPKVILGRYRHTGTDELLIINAADGTINKSVALATITKVFAAPVVGDVDNDGQPEIVAVGSANKVVYCVSPTGTIDWQTTLPATAAKTSPIMGDFDADGRMEVVVVTDDGRVCYLDGSTGAIKKTISTGLSVEASPIAADVNNDKYLEVIVSGIGTSVVAIDWRGTVKSWPASPSAGSKRIATPVAADTDGDGIPEIIVVDSHLRVLSWSSPPYEQSVGTGWSNLGNSPVVFDSNNDGSLDILYFMTSSSNSGLYRIVTTTPSTQKGWMTLKNDFRRSGVFGSDLYGVDPDIAINNYNWSYGNVSRGSVVYKDFTITNHGKVALTGTCTGQTRIVINDTSSFSINPGTSKGFRATFDTSQTGIQTGFVIITTNDPDEPRLNLTATANVTQPQHDIAAYAIHIASQLNPNYVPPVVCEFRNLGAFRETAISSNLTINGILCSNLTPRVFSLDPGQAFNVTFRWDRSNPSLAGEGTFVLVSAAQSANITEESDKLNNRLTKNVEVKYPILVNSVTSWTRVNLTTYSATSNFTEGDVMNLKVVLTNQYSVPVTILPLVDVVDATGAPLSCYFHAGSEVTLAAGQEYTFWVGWRLGMPISSTTKYNATVYVYDRFGGGVKILARPFVHAFWVQSS